MAAKKKKKKVSPIPKGYGTVTAALCQNDARATIAFCKKAFGAKLRGGMMLGPDKKVMHSEVMIGDSVIMVSDAVMDEPRVSSLFLYVDNVDKTIAKAVKAGAKVMMPAADQFWGDRFGRIADPLGNFWSIATHIEDVPDAEMKKRSKAAARAMPAGG
jgi:PhnB protein